MKLKERNMANGTTDKDTESKDNAAGYFGYKEAEVKAPKEGEETNQRDFQAQVNNLLKETKVTDDGKFEFPEGTADWAKVAVANEKKFRDTQSGYTKSQQDNKALQAEND